MNSFYPIILCIAVHRIHAQTLRIGGKRDDHGCLPSAGYSWDPSTNTCVRPWVESLTPFAPISHRCGCVCPEDACLAEFPCTQRIFDMEMSRCILKAELAGFDDGNPNVQRDNMQMVQKIPSRGNPELPQNHDDSNSVPRDDGQDVGCPRGTLWCEDQDKCVEELFMEDCTNAPTMEDEEDGEVDWYYAGYDGHPGVDDDITPGVGDGDGRDYYDAATKAANLPGYDSGTPFPAEGDNDGVLLFQQ
jgi:hypothetical protein